MKTSHTAVLDRNARYTGRSETEPYEAGWASEARFFFGVEDVSGTWSAQVEVSPDGPRWCVLGEPLQISAVGLTSCAAREFGAWLRVSFEPLDEHATLHTHVYLALKG